MGGDFDYIRKREYFGSALGCIKSRDDNGSDSLFTAIASDNKHAWPSGLQDTNKTCDMTNRDYS